MISAGEVHTPGRPRDAAGTKALAILAAKAWNNFHPSGVKVQGGSVLLERGLTENHFAEMAARASGSSVKSAFRQCGTRKKRDLWRAGHKRTE